MAYGYSDIVQITGLAEMQTKLTAFGEKVVNTVTQQGLNDGAKIFQSEAVHQIITRINRKDAKEHNLKVNGTYIKIQPGNLSRNIRRRRVKKPEAGTKQAQVYVYGKMAWYGKFVEGVENGSSRQEPQPFMRPAFEIKKDEAVQAFENRISEAVKDGGL